MHCNNCETQTAISRKKIKIKNAENKGKPETVKLPILISLSAKIKQNLNDSK